jgi:hypothetical protein
MSREPELPPSMGALMGMTLLIGVMLGWVFATLYISGINSFR